MSGTSERITVTPDPTNMFVIAIPFRSMRRTSQRSAGAAVVRSWRVLNARPWNIAGFVALTVGAIAYLALVNGNATAGYELRTLERRSEALREDVRRLDFAALAAQSVDRITERMTPDTFIPVAHMDFLTPTDRAVAQK